MSRLVTDNPIMEDDIMTDNQHVVKRNEGWAVRREKAQRDTVRCQTQQEAIGKARGIAINQRSEVVIHGLDGRIRDKDSYGNDKCPPRDTRH